MKLRKRIVSLSVIVMLVTTCIPSYANTIDSKSNNKLFTNLFYEADDDEVVLYYKEHSILKRDIDLETGEISKNKLKEIAIENDNFQSKMTASTSTRIPSPYNEAVIEKVLSAPRFGQRTTTYYLTTKSGMDLAKSLDFNFRDNFILLLSGFIPKVGPVISVGGFFASARDADLARKIRDQTDKGYNVEWSATKNQYGTFYAADYWNGSTIDLSVINSDITTEEITSIAYRKK